MSDAQQPTLSTASNGNSNSNTNTNVTSGNTATSANGIEGTMTGSNAPIGGILGVPIVGQLLLWLLSIRSVADNMPPMFHSLLTSGRWSVAVVAGGYLVVLALCLPFWLLSWVVSEAGIYVIAMLTVFLVGRSIIRLIAFPGASQRVSSEIENEFAKYSVRILVSASNSTIDVASAVLSACKENGNGQQAGFANVLNGGSVFQPHEIPILWKRAKSFRNRVLAVYFETLSYILDGTATSATITSPQGTDSSLQNRTKYGNNRLSGDVGNLLGVTPQARMDGRQLCNILARVLDCLGRLEQQAAPVLEPSGTGKPPRLSNDASMIASSLIISASELRDFVSSLKPNGSGLDDTHSEDGMADDGVTMDAMRRQLEGPNGPSLNTVKAGVASVVPMLDPPLHTSIFGFDILRGCTLARYHGARQFWVPREASRTNGGGGLIDVLCIPAVKPHGGRNSKAVLYCNPNAGLIEVATGMSLAGGNVTSDTDDAPPQDNCWADYYTNLGYDVYLFNYAGFGRSYGLSSLFCTSSRRRYDEIHVPGAWARVRRIFRGILSGFQPTPDTLRSDGQSVGKFLISELGVDDLVIHGESIGGVAASSTARALTESPFYAEKVSMLLCDRTFCNLEAVAQRLVGGWSGYAIRMLAPFWSTDVAGDFLAANCKKVVANDAADMIIADSSSLKSGIAYWKELYRGALSTHGVGWIIETPLEYRMAEWENVCVNDSRYVQSSFTGTQPPVWPADKYISLEEAFHFAACVKRIGKLASTEKRQIMSTPMSQQQDNQTNAEVASNSPIVMLWKALGSCDGLCGFALGIAVRTGFDCTVAWLCTLLTYGGQVVVEAMEHRLGVAAGATSWPREEVLPSDFDCRPPGFEKEESEASMHPKPLPEVIGAARAILNERGGDEMLRTVLHEISFVLGTLDYVVLRLSSAPVVETSWKNRHLRDDSSMVGSFLNLHCGHNNSFSPTEQTQLQALLQEAVPGDRSV